jgi:hypothetical protein
MTFSVLFDHRSTGLEDMHTEVGFMGTTCQLGRAFRLFGDFCAWHPHRRAWMHVPRPTLPCQSCLARRKKEEAFQLGKAERKNAASCVFLAAWRMKPRVSNFERA